MRGRNGLVATLAGVVLAGVAACGGGNPPVFHPAGSPLPTAQADTLQRQVTTAPGGYKFPSGVSIELSALPASSAKRAIVAAYQNYVLSLWAAVLSHGHDSAYQQLTAGNARAFVRKEVSYFAGRGIRGTIRYTGAAVTAVYYGHGATVSDCVDASAFDITGANAGPVFPPKYAHYLETVAEGRRPGGTWYVAHTESFPASTSEGAKCR